MIDNRLRLVDDTNIPAQWAANLLGPLAVLLGMELGYLFVRPACRSGDLLPLHLSFAVTLGLALTGGFIALGLWRRWETAPEGEAGRPSRSRFMAATGLLASALSALVLAAQWLASAFLDPCQ